MMSYFFYRVSQNGTFGVYFYDIKRHNVMTQEGKGKTKQSRVATLIERIDAKFIAAGLGGKSVQLEPDPTRHRIIVRMPRQKSSGQSEK